jgi:hypothetical protein
MPPACGGFRVDIRRVHPCILVGNPGHFAFTRAHVGRGHVLRRVDQVALDQLVREAPGDLFQFMFVPGPRVDAEAALGPAEGRFHQRAFVGHQRGQRLHLVLVHRQGKADAALHRLHMFRMHRPVTGEGFDLAAQPDPEADGVGGVADADLLLQPRRQVHQADRPVEHEVDGFAETRLTGSMHWSVPFPDGGHPYRDSQ